MTTYQDSAVLGLIQAPYDDEPWLGGGTGTTTTTTSTTPKKSLTDSISDWLGLAKQGAEVFQTVKNQDGSVTYVMPNTPPPPAQNNTMKYVLIGGGALLAIGAVVMLTKGGKKKSLGDVGAVKKGKKRKK